MNIDELTQARLWFMANSMEQRIGEAWRLHRSSDYKSATAEFERILGELEVGGGKPSKDNLNLLAIDAYYGLGLAQRSSGDSAQASASFQKAYALCSSAYAEIQKRNEAQHLHNDLGSTDDDRLMMLRTMLAQRLKELGATPTG